MSCEKIIALLGFANRAGKLAIGRSAVIKAHLKNKVYGVVVAADASDKIASITADWQVAIFTCGTKDELGQILGRDKVAIIGIMDQGFVKAIRKALAD